MPLVKHQPWVKRLRREIRWPSATPPVTCPACGDPVRHADHSVSLHGDAFHAACVLYSPRPARRSAQALTGRL